MHSLKSLHTFGLDAYAQQILVVDSIEQLHQLVAPFWILGQGSNCIFLDDYQGTIAKIALKGIDVVQDADAFYVTAAAGEEWHQLVCHCLDKGIWGLENLALIPGTVGAAPIQNIGAYGVEVEKFIDRVEYYDIESQQIRSLEGHACKFGYRDSVFKHRLNGKVVITKVHFVFPKAWQSVTQYGELAQMDSPSAMDIFKKVVAIRQAKLPDPARLGNAGSFFKNPLVSNKHLAALHCDWPQMPFYKVDQHSVKVPAAWLIDQLGFKGKTIGGVQCHPSQPLVLANLGNGNAAELLALAGEIKAKVKSAFSIELENEVRLIGKQGMITL